MTLRLVTKRAFDLTAATVGLIVIAPLLLAVAILIARDSRGPIFYTQVRVGVGFRRFRLYKFRTMVPHADAMGGAITCANDPRVTRVGRWLRQTKLDELPQLINVIKGDMSIVGPRPEVPQFVELYPREYGDILTVRPGLTDPASLKYRDEAGLLGRSADPHEEYVRRILPDKIGLAREYIRQSSLRLDVSLILRTLIRIGRRQPG